MLITLFFRICIFVGLCKIDDYQDIKPDSINLNSFTSKTAYRNVNLQPLHIKNDKLEKCYLIQSNAIFRHGTRFPSAKDIEKMQVLHKKIIKSHAKSVLPEPFQNWVPVFDVKKAKELSSVGFEEMMLIGERMRDKLKALSGNFDPIKHVKIYTSSSSRSKLSGASFYRSFLNVTKPIKDMCKMITENDKYLRFFDNCPFYTDHVINNKAYRLEFNRFLSGSEMKRVLRDIQQKWKLTDVPLTTDDIRVLYVTCGYEIATNLSSYMKPHTCPPSPAGDGLVVCPHKEIFKSVESSPLCSLFLRNHYEVVEYLYDLKHYWTKSYGAEVNWLQSCELMSPLLQHIVDAARHHETAKKTYESGIKKGTFESMLSNEDYYRGTYWFGHAETLLPIFSLLNLFNQSHPMVASNYQTHLSLLEDKNERFDLFRVSNMAPFSGNIDLELYYCPELVDSENNGYRVQVKVNERKVKWSIANGYSHLSLEKFLKHLNLCLPDKYDHDAVCVKGLSRTQLHELRRRSDEL